MGGNGRGGAFTSVLWEQGPMLGPLLGSALRTLSFERISEVDEEEEQSDLAKDLALSRRSSRTSRSSRSSASSASGATISTPSSAPSSARGVAGLGAYSLSATTTSVSLDEDDADGVSPLEEDATLADLSTVSSLSEGTDGDLYCDHDDLRRLVEDVVGEDEDLAAVSDTKLEVQQGDENGRCHSELSEGDFSEDPWHEPVDGEVDLHSSAKEIEENVSRGRLEDLVLESTVAKKRTVDQNTIPHAEPPEERPAGHVIRPPGTTTTGITWDDRDPDAKLEALALGCVLEDAVDQLCILAYTSRAARLAPDLANQLLNERLEAIDARETERRNSVIPGLTLGAADSGEDNARVDKIQRDRAMVQEALRLQLVWLRGPGHWTQWSHGLLQESPLCRLVREEERRVAEEATMMEDSAEGAGRADTLRSRARADEQEARRQLRAMKEERAQLQEEARGVRARAALGAAITERWERARLQQHKRRLHDQEAGLAAALGRLEEDYGLELRAHAELVEYLRQATESLEQQSEEWQARYDQVTAGWDAKLAALKVQRHERTRQLRAVRRELARRERFKKDFLAYKAARDQQIEERVRRNTAATRIQSWWRMTMVRKGFGPWKRMAKKKKKKKK